MINYSYMPEPENEAVLSYAPGSPERARLLSELETHENGFVKIPVIVGGEEIYTERHTSVVSPHNHQRELGIAYQGGEDELKMAVDAALKAKKQWESLGWQRRAAIFLKAADLLSHKYRYLINAVTMLNMSKSVHQAEIDAACELSDFLRYNVKYAEQIFSHQPKSDARTQNSLEYRSLEGFVLAISPFNFTAIAGNLAAAPALLGNTVVWKPSTTALLSGYYLMKIFKEAGLPDGVINFVPSSGKDVSAHVIPHPELAGVHFTGSTGVFKNIWKQVAENIDHYRSFPRVVGETGGKNYIFMHPSAEADVVATALIRGAFEYQGQKCSACSRAYIPESRWAEVKGLLKAELSKVKMGDVTDFGNFMNAVIDESSFDKTMGYIRRAEQHEDVELLYGGKGNKSVGYFIEPTVLVVDDPHYETMREEIFAPVLSIYVYPDAEIGSIPELIDNTTPYALTGSIFCSDPYEIERFSHELKNSSGNFYINDKPTGAVVGRQPFGGARGSGTNDKAGSYLNLLKWISPRTVKECMSPPADFAYPYMASSDNAGGANDANDTSDTHDTHDTNHIKGMVS